MKPKSFFFLCLVFAVVLLISSAFAVETSKNDQQVGAAEDQKNQFGGEKYKYYCNHGCCRYYGRRCIYCCSNAEEARLMANRLHPQNQEGANSLNDEKYHGGGGYGHGGGGYGHGGGGYGHGGGGYGHGGGGHGGGGHGGRGGGKCCGEDQKGSTEAKP